MSDEEKVRQVLERVGVCSCGHSMSQHGIFGCMVLTPGQYVPTSENFCNCGRVGRAGANEFSTETED
jgi:hypothetical protein